MLFKRVRLSAARKAGLYLEFHSLEIFHDLNLIGNNNFDHEINAIDLVDVNT